MEWVEIFPEHRRWVNCEWITNVLIDNLNLRAHLIASWACLQELQKEVKELKEWKHSIINRLDE